MAKFLGVISTSYQHPSDDLVIEFTDLDLLANFLFHETQNLSYEFQRKFEVVKEQEINLCQNLNRIIEIHEIERSMNKTTQELEQEIEKIGFCLKNIEKSIDCLDIIPTNFTACKSTSNPERKLILEKLVNVSEEFMRIEHKIDEIKKEENCTSRIGPCDLTKNLHLILDLHTQILENIEKKSHRLTDQLKTVDGIFINAHKRSIGACYHKPRHEVSSSIC